MKLILFVSLIIISQGLYGQTFLNKYKDFCIHRLDSIKVSFEKQGLKTSCKWIRQYKNNLEQQILQYDIIFSEYKNKNNYDFNTADSLIIIYQKGIENNISNCIIYNSKDSISFEEIDKKIKPLKYKKEIVYKPFLDSTIFDERDSLMILASKKDFQTLHRLEKENLVFDGATTIIIFAKKINGKYIIDECYLKPFGLSINKRKKK